MNTDTHTSGSPVKNHIALKTVFGYSATRRTSFLSLFQACQRVLPQACRLQHPWNLQGRKLIILRLPQARLPHQPWHLQLCQAKVARQERWDPCGIDHHPAIVSSERVERQERGEPCHSEIPEWLQEFRENLVDDRVPERRDSHASSSHEPSSEPTRSEDLGKQC